MSMTVQHPAARNDRGNQPALRRPHIFAKPGKEQIVVARAERAQVSPQRTGFDYPTTFAGQTAHYCVYYDSALGANGLTIANAVLANCENDYNTLVGWFGGLVPAANATPTNENPTGALFNVLIAALDPSGQGGGGAYHYGCAAGDIYIDAKTAPSLDTDYSNFLVVAEISEVFQANMPGAPWNCGASNGEGLSRVNATEIYPAQLDGYTSAASWLDNGRPNFVDSTDPTDRNYISTGCAVLFLNYLHYQLDFAWPEIVAAGAPTLAGTYQNLTGQTDGFAQFSNLLAAYFPNNPSGVTSDNVFPLGTALSYPFTGVQFRGTVGPNSTATWFTYGWPALWAVEWTVVPTSQTSGPVGSSFTVQKSGDAGMTYYISIANGGNENVDIEARYTVLGAV